MTPLRFPKFAFARSFARVVVDLWLCPHRWRKLLHHEPFPRVIDGLEKEVRELPPLHLSPEFVAKLINRRVKMTIRWRQNRCVLAGLLLGYCLPRTGCPVTVHLGSWFAGNQLEGHCWISSPSLSEPKRFFNHPAAGEIFHKEFAARTYPVLPHKDQN
jgi:hypothetical protein